MTDQPTTFQPIGVIAARIVHRLRRDRDMARGQRMADAVRTSGGSAMDAALAHIDGTFNKAAPINAFKMRVEQAMCRGAYHPANRARYGRRTAMLRNASLAGAIVRVDQWYRDERKAFQIASALGSGNRLSLEVLHELRLILRFIRAKGADFSEILGAILGASEPGSIAAE